MSFIWSLPTVLASLLHSCKPLFHPPSRWEFKCRQISLGMMHASTFSLQKYKECGYDGGDCSKPVEVEGHPGCFVSNNDGIGNGFFVDQPHHGSPECSLDGGDYMGK